MNKKNVLVVSNPETMNPKLLEWISNAGALDMTFADTHEQAIELSNQQLNEIHVRLAGRISSPPRVMGKAAFVHLSDGISRLQIYIRRADVVGICNDAQGGDVDGWSLFQLLDHGDFIGVEGYLFVTKTGELSVHVQKLQFLSKALLPLPDKMHGLHDPEIRQRQRYADLIAGSLKLEQDGSLSPREVFERRASAIREMRRILEDHGYSAGTAGALLHARDHLAERFLLLNGRVNNLEYGSYAPNAPQDVFIDDAGFRERWQSGDLYYICVEGPQVSRLETLVGKPALHELIASGGKYVFSNQ